MEWDEGICAELIGAYTSMDRISPTSFLFCPLFTHLHVPDGTIDRNPEKSFQGYPIFLQRLSKTLFPFQEDEGADSPHPYSQS